MFENRQRSAGLSLLLVSLSLIACAEPGSSRMTAFAAEDGEVLWSRTLPTETFAASSSEPPGAIQVLGYDDCPGAHFDRDYAIEDGKLLRKRPTGPSSGFGGPTVYVPSSPCGIAVRRRYELGQGRLVDVCAGVGLTLQDVQTGQVLLELEQVGWIEPYDAGVLVSQEDGYTLYALDGQLRWSWPRASTWMNPIGGNAERIFMFDDETGQLIALEAADGSTAWQAQTGCSWASYASGVVVCGRVTRKSTCEESD